MPRALLAMTGDTLHGWYRSGAVRFRQGPATLKLDWALDGPIPWTASEPRGAGTVHIGGDEARPIASLAQARTGLAERPFLLLGQQSIADPSRAPAGKHTAWAYTHGPRQPRSELGSERYVEAVEQQVERFAPGFRDRILARHVLGPRDLEARNANLVGGDVGGGSYGGLQSVFRPLPAVSPYRTPIDGLFLAALRRSRAAPYTGYRATRRRARRSGRLAADAHGARHRSAGRGVNRRTLSARRRASAVAPGRDAAGSGHRRRSHRSVRRSRGLQSSSTISGWASTIALTRSSTSSIAATSHARRAAVPVEQRERAQRAQHLAWRRDRSAA